MLHFIAKGFQYALRLDWRWWALSLGVSLMAMAWQSARLSGRDRRFTPIASTGILAGYYSLVLVFTVASRHPRTIKRPVNLDMFGTVTRRFLYEPTNRYEVVLNTLMFVPIGTLLPLAFRFNLNRTTLTALLMSSILEVAQLILSRGSFELSDIFTNVMGAMVGYGACAALSAIGDWCANRTTHGQYLVNSSCRRTCCRIRSHR